MNSSKKIQSYHKPTIPSVPPPCPTPPPPSVPYIPPATPSPLRVCYLDPIGLGLCPVHNPPIPSSLYAVDPNGCTCVTDDEYAMERSYRLSAYTDGASDAPSSRSLRTTGTPNIHLATSLNPNHTRQYMHSSIDARFLSAQTDGAADTPSNVAVINAMSTCGSSGPPHANDIQRPSSLTDTRVYRSDPSTSTSTHKRLPTLNTPRKSKCQNSESRFYSVTRGRRIGVVDSWAEASALTSGISRGVSTVHLSYEDALADYRKAVIGGYAAVARRAEDTDEKWGPREYAAQPL